MTLRERLRVTLRGYSVIHRRVPGLLCTLFFQQLAHSVLPFLNIYMSAQIITALASQETLSQLLWLVSILVGLNLLANLVNSGMERLGNFYREKLWHLEDQPLYEKIQSMDYQRVEDAATHQQLEQFQLLRTTNSLGFPRLYWCLLGALRGIFTVAFSLTFTVSAFLAGPAEDPGQWHFVFAPWFALLLGVVVLVGVVLDVMRSIATTKSLTKMMAGFQSTNRVGRFVMENLKRYKVGMDVKLYAMDGILQSVVQDLMGTIGGVMAKYQKVQAKFEWLGAAISAFISFLVYGYVALKALFGAFGVGSIVQYAGSLSQLSKGVTELMGAVSMLLYNGEALKLLFDFFDMPSERHHGTLSVEKRSDHEYEIEFHNVSFRYPGTEEWAVKELNMKLKIGQKLAVVGQNGSGKTTMIKLLCRLYDPTEGIITLNGIDIKKYEYQEYLALFSVVFQDFKLFSFSLGQNVGATTAYDQEKAIRCLEQAGFGERFSRLPQGLSTPLYKDFEDGGVEISGGEAQKIALARALYKDAPFIVLDEPTAALDPVAEYEIYTRFNEIVDNKTAIYISHRLSSCRFCDDIAVFHKGILVQRGSHQHLMEEEGGKYHTLWTAQSQYYTD